MRWQVAHPRVGALVIAVERQREQTCVQIVAIEQAGIAVEAGLYPRVSIAVRIASRSERNRSRSIRRRPLSCRVISRSTATQQSTLEWV